MARQGGLLKEVLLVEISVFGNLDSVRITAYADLVLATNTFSLSYHTFWLIRNEELLGHHEE